MLVYATVNTPGQEGNRPWIGKATKYNYGVKSHGSNIHVDTRDVAIAPQFYINPRTGKPYVANDAGTKILVEEADIVSTDNVVGAAERGSADAEYTRTMNQYRMRTARRNELLDAAHLRSLEAKGLLGSGVEASESEAIGIIRENLTDPIAELVKVSGIGESTAAKLVAIDILSPMDLVGLTREQLIETGIPSVSVDKVLAWIDENIEVVQDE